MDKYPDMSALYKIQFEQEERLKSRIKDLEADVDLLKNKLKFAEDCVFEMMGANVIPSNAAQKILKGIKID